MYVVILEFDSLEDAHEVCIDELQSVCRSDNGEPLHQTLAGAVGLQLWFQGTATHKGRYEVYKLEKVE